MLTRNTGGFWSGRNSPWEVKNFRTVKSKTTAKSEVK